MNKKIEIYGFLIGFFIFFATIAYAQNESGANTVVAQENDKIQVQTDQVVQNTENTPKTKKELAKIALKNGLFAVISEHYKIEPELLLAPKILFMILISYAGRFYAANNDTSYPIKTFIAANLLASGVNGLIVNSGATLAAVPFDSAILYFTDATVVKYSFKSFLLGLTRGVVYTGQLVAQSIVGGLLGQCCTFK